MSKTARTWCWIVAHHLRRDILLPRPLIPPPILVPILVLPSSSSHPSPILVLSLPLPSSSSHPPLPPILVLSSPLPSRRALIYPPPLVCPVLTRVVLSPASSSHPHRPLTLVLSSTSSCAVLSSSPSSSLHPHRPLIRVLSSPPPFIHPILSSYLTLSSCKLLLNINGGGKSQMFFLRKNNLTKGCLGQFGVASTSTVTHWQFSSLSVTIACASPHYLSAVHRWLSFSLRELGRTYMDGRNVYRPL